ncbi:hypothetical protein CHS0354_008976 [Potamilus streckersoni]|uniref:Uncharacterized protein n=1 Tax=Potamilus streckersoni TaxID=2493646 RepID=A0AAE0TIH1_9BIVA|nr:hypothetical protein CHS0354_008976 [Potamilus streckersoni]
MALHNNTSVNCYIELLSDTHLQTEPQGGANNENNQEPYRSKEQTLKDYAHNGDRNQLFQEHTMVSNHILSRYSVMQKCWLVDPNDRPTFSVLAKEIADMASVAEQDMQQGLLRIDIHHAQFNQADSAKYHYAYDDTYLEPSTSKPICGANSGNDYLNVFDDTNDVQIEPMECANGDNKNEPYRYAYDDSSLERPSQSESVDDATNNFMDEYDDTNDVQIYLTGGTKSNSSDDSCHDERVSFAVYAPVKLPEDI